MTADRVAELATAAIDQECMMDYVSHAHKMWDLLTDTSDAITASDVCDDYRLALFAKMLQPYKYYKDDWLAREQGVQQLVDVMQPAANVGVLMSDKPADFDARPVDSEAYRNLKSEALAKAAGRLESTEFYGMLDLCKRRVKGKTVEPVHGKEKLIQNVIEAGLLGRLELENFLAGKVRQG